MLFSHGQRALNHWFCRPHAAGHVGADGILHQKLDLQKRIAKLVCVTGRGGGQLSAVVPLGFELPRIGLLK